MDFENYLSINSLCCYLRPSIYHLISHGVGNILDGLYDEHSIKIYEVTTGRPCIDYCAPLSTGNKDVGDRFKLKIPYGGKQIVWDIIFNSLSPEDPPDFNLNDDNFTRAINADSLERFVPSLANWKYDDPAKLKNVVCELLSFYKKFQVAQLKEENCCWFEYISILKTELINEDDVEVLVGHNGLVHFLIRLCPDLTDYNLPRSHKDYAAHVGACFCINTGNKISKPQVKLTSFLDDCLTPKSLSINDSCTLAEYLVKLHEGIEDALSPIFLKPIAKRKRFIFEWLALFGRKVIEFDALKFVSVSILMENDGFNFIFLIKLSKDFPISPPEYKFQSVYSPALLVIPVNGVPYHSKWNFNTMVVNAINFVENKISAFKKICVENLS